jgi:hypothetical protein
MPSALIVQDGSPLPEPIHNMPGVGTDVLGSRGGSAAAVAWTASSAAGSAANADAMGCCCCCCCCCCWPFPFSCCCSYAGLFTSDAITGIGCLAGLSSSSRAGDSLSLVPGRLSSLMYVTMRAYKPSSAFCSRKASGSGTCSTLWSLT